MSAQNASCQTQSESQEWGQEGVCESQDLKRQREEYVSLLDIKELR